MPPQSWLVRRRKDCFNLLKVFSEKFHFVTAALLLAFGHTAVAAGNFALPAEGPVAFRRDRVPLDVDTMGKLSMQLVTLANGMEGKTPAERRGAAQMLALALALDPGHARARRVLEEFESGKHQADGDAENLAKSRTRIWQWIGWLETAAAGNDGQALAACLKDVVAVSDPSDPRVAELLANAQKGAWAEWLPAEAAYEESTTTAPTQEEEMPQDPVEKPEILLTQAMVSTPLWKQIDKDDNTQWKLEVAPLRMVASAASAEDAEQTNFSLMLGKPETGGQLTSLIDRLRKLLTAQHGKLPAGRTVTIDSPELEISLASGQRHSVSGAIGVLASSAISGREPEATIIGTLDSTGTFKLPSDFWDQLRAVDSGNGGRLVLPNEAAAYLPSMLAMENPKFFMDHEVVLAADFKQLLSLSAKTPDEAIARISAQFSEIRGKMGTQPLGQYVANSFIRRRLAEISQAAPYHYSAKMLAIQGAGNRPIYVSRLVVMSELRRAIKPLDWVVEHGYSEYESAEANAIGATFESCRSEIERLQRYTEKADRGLVDQAMTMVTLLRPIERAAKARPDPEDYSGRNSQMGAISAFLKSRKEVFNMLSQTSQSEPSQGR